MNDQHEDDFDALFESARRLKMPGTVTPQDVGFGVESGLQFVARMRERDARDSRRRRRWVVGFAGLVTTTAVVGGLLLLPQNADRAVAATPAILSYEYAQAGDVAYAPGRDARRVLNRLADVARAHTGAGSGKVQRVTTASWDAQLDADADDPSAKIVTTDRTTWLRPDGSQVNQDTAGETVSANGDLRVDQNSGQVARETLPAGTFDAARLAKLGSDPETVKARLLKRAECDTSTQVEVARCLYREIVDVYTNYVVPGRTAAAFWTVLAGQADVRSLGKVRDRSGRVGVGIAFPNDQEDNLRSILIVSSTTGQLLGREVLLTRDDESLGVQAPAIYSFSSITSARLTTEVGP